MSAPTRALAPALVAAALVAVTATTASAAPTGAAPTGAAASDPRWSGDSLPAAPANCTVVIARRDGVYLVGNNEDWNDPSATILFRPAAWGKHGCVFFGFRDGAVQGGMNDAGLVVDGNSLPPTGWDEEDEAKPVWERETIKELLLSCADCAEVEAFFRKYEVPELGSARFPVADRSGDAMVVEYSRGRVVFHRSPAWYLIATNFVAGDYPEGPAPCARYRNAERMLAYSSRLDLRLMKDILLRTHQEGAGLTVYSYICEPERGYVRVYREHDFSVAYEFSLEEELAKGYRRQRLAELFPSD